MMTGYENGVRLNERLETKYATISGDKDYISLTGNEKHLVYDSWTGAYFMERPWPPKI
jgi:hypothetical protein